MGIWDALFNTGRSREDEGKSRRKAEEVLSFTGLADRASELARNIPQEAQKRLAVGLALVTEPKLLLLDEPMGGLTEEENAGMMRLIEKIRGQGISILLIEHEMKVVMKISDRIVVLNYSSKIAPREPGGSQPESRSHRGLSRRRICGMKRSRGCLLAEEWEWKNRG